MRDETGERCRAPLTRLYPVVKAQSLGRFALTFLQSSPHMFFLFSNRLGCFGSIVAAIVLTVLLMFVLRACGTGLPGSASLTRG